MKMSVIAAASAALLSSLVAWLVFLNPKLDNRGDFILYTGVSFTVVVAIYFAATSDNKDIEQRGKVKKIIKKSLRVAVGSLILHSIWVMFTSFEYSDGSESRLYIKGFIYTENAHNETNMSDARLFQRYSQGLPSEIGKTWVNLTVIINKVMIATFYFIFVISLTGFLVNVFLPLVPQNIFPNVKNPPVKPRVTKPTWKKSSELDLNKASFDVSFSFPGTLRMQVEEIILKFVTLNTPYCYFYDAEHKAQLAKPAMDILLSQIYRNRSNLIVVFLSSDYKTSEWCGVEFNIIRDIIKQKGSDRIMYLKVDDVEMTGVLSIDGYIDTRIHSPTEIAELIKERLIKSESKQQANGTDSVS